MLYTHFTEELVGLQDLIITKINTTQISITIHAEIKRKPHLCPCCGTATETVHDYRTQVIKDIPAFGKSVVLALRKRRYRCQHCGKRFYEQNSFLPRYYRNTCRLNAYILNQLRNERSFSSVAREVSLSVSTVIRRFDLVNYGSFQLPDVLSIDEFKGNTSGEKYQCILTDPVNRRVLDILPKRYEHYLTDYFRKFPKEERKQVKFFVSDMWKVYYNTAGNWFSNADRVIDKYHWIRQVMWAFENVRKQEQKRFSKEYRRYFKHSRKLLLKRFDNLSDEQKQQVNMMLYASPTLSRSHFYKEKFLEMLDKKDKEQAKAALKEWISYTAECDIPQFEKCAETLRNWLTGILNSFDTSITNGFTEGCNNKIKVLKRNAYGFRNFNRFRNRILHMFSQNQHIQKQLAA